MPKFGCAIGSQQGLEKIALVRRRQTSQVLRLVTPPLSTFVVLHVPVPLPLARKTVAVDKFSTLCKVAPRSPHWTAPFRQQMKGPLIDALRPTVPAFPWCQEEAANSQMLIRRHDESFVCVTSRRRRVIGCGHRRCLCSSSPVAAAWSAVW